MSDIRIVTKNKKFNEFRERINEHYNKYYNIKITDKDYIQIFYNSYIELLAIKKNIGNYFGILDRLPNLYSRTLISTRLSIIDEKKQYQNEIKYKTQCLKKNNTVQIEAVNESTSDFREKFIFNKKAFIQFTYIGVTGTEEEPGIYKIKIPNDYTFGILYDFEEDLNKKYSRDIVETLIYISKGTTYGEPRIIKEDKWIRTPGDLPNNEDNEGILNIGRYEFNVQFYKGNIELTVTGDFGTISYYCIKNGYMGGQKRLKYSDICLKV